MSRIFSDEAELLFKEFIGAKIVRVRRQIFEGDMDREGFEQSADGPTEITLNSGCVFFFFANTESFSVEVETGNMPTYGDSYKLFDLTDNIFWNRRTNKNIRKITVMKSKEFDDEFNLEFCLQVELDNELGFCVEYLNDSKSPDMIIISDRYLGGECVKKIINESH